MSFLTLSLSLIFVLIPIALSKALNLGLEKDTIIATVRSIIQLLAVGYVLTFVFTADHYMYIILMIMLMIGAATQNARKKGASIKGITWKLVGTFFFVEILTQAILLGFQITPPIAQYIIPISGMVVGNSMVLSILFLNRFTAEIASRQDETELILSLGGTPKQAIHTSLITSIKASMIPTIESQKDNRARAASRYDERTDYCRCRSSSGSSISTADIVPSFDNGRSDECSSWISVLSDPF